MSGFWATLVMALRAATWRSTRNVPYVRLPVLLAWSGLYIALQLVLDYAAAGEGWRFHPAGLNFWVALTAIVLLVASVFIERRARLTALSGLLALNVICDPVERGIYALASRYVGDLARIPESAPVSASTLLYIATVSWGVGAMFCVLRSVELQRPSAFRLAGRVAAMSVVMTIVVLALPWDNAFRGRNFDIAQSNWWESIRTSWIESAEPPRAPAPRSPVARAELQQPALLQAAFERIAPQRDGKTDVYALGIAGWSRQDVFVKELDGALAAITPEFAIADRTVRLINHRSSLFQNPLANRQNFAAAVRAIGKAMNKDEDVLLIFMTSHGSQDGFEFFLPGSVNASLAPEDVAETLDAEGIRNRVVIVSACYSGTFVKPLSNDDTVVMTASDSLSTSFGCSNEREWTYFGQALFDGGMIRHSDLERAFDDAKSQIVEWEARDKLPASNPQVHFGPAIMSKLRALTGETKNAGNSRPIAEP